MDNKKPKKILYIDMDNVLVDFKSGLERVPLEIITQYAEEKLDEIPGVFSLMDPMPGAIEAFHVLAKIFDTYILSTAPWNNPSAWQDKLLWVQEYLGDAGYKRLILTHHKDLNRGDFLIDDKSTKNGVENFQGELIQFGSPRFQNWGAVLEYLLRQS